MTTLLEHGAPHPPKLDICFAPPLPSCTTDCADTLFDYGQHNQWRFADTGFVGSPSTDSCPSDSE
eukprot:9531835-Alexandrium_andersonii.AAC.1